MFTNKDLFKTYQAQTFPHPSCLEIKSAKGSYIIDINDKKYLALACDKLQGIVIIDLQDDFETIFEQCFV